MGQRPAITSPPFPIAARLRRPAVEEAAPLHPSALFGRSFHGCKISPVGEV
jgi:hypothetical protein